MIGEALLATSSQHYNKDRDQREDRRPTKENPASAHRLDPNNGEEKVQIDTEITILMDALGDAVCGADGDRPKRRRITIVSI